MDGAGAGSNRALYAMGSMTLLFSFLATVLSGVAVHRTGQIKSDVSGNASDVSPESEPLVNLQINKNNIKLYHSSGKYDSDLWSLAGNWQAHFEKSLSDTFPRKDNGTVVVFDCDDTVLSNWPEFLSSDFGYIPNQFDAWVEQGDAPAIKQTVEFAQYLYSKGFDLYFITGRKEAWRAPTLKNLRLIGLYVNDDRLILRDDQELKMQAVEYKSKERARLVAQGIDIAGCVGDQVSDCAGGNAGYIMKVPNYMYLIE